MPLLSTCSSRSSCLVAPLKCSTACLGACVVTAGDAPPCAGFCICVCPAPPPCGTLAAAAISSDFFLDSLQVSFALLLLNLERFLEWMSLVIGNAAPADKKSLSALWYDVPGSSLESQSSSALLMCLLSVEIVRQIQSSRFGFLQAKSV